MKREGQPRLRRALEELRGLIRERHPTATFAVRRGPEDPRQVWLVATVEEGHPDAIPDLVMERVLELQIEEKLPVFVRACCESHTTAQRAAQTAPPLAPQPFLAELRAERELALELELLDLELAFPAVYADAERFVSQTNALPWEFAVAFAEGELGQIQEKYGIVPSRHRPDPAAVPPLTDLFCEACQLIFQWRSAFAPQSATAGPSAAVPRCCLSISQPMEFVRTRPYVAWRGRRRLSEI